MWEDEWERSIEDDCWISYFEYYMNSRESWREYRKHAIVRVLVHTCL